MDPVVGVQVGDEDAPRIHALSANQLPVQVPAAPGHGAAFADHDPRLQGIEDMDELRERGAELALQGVHVAASLLVGLAGDDGADLPLHRPVGLCQRPDGAAQLVERLGVGRDQGQVRVAAPIGRSVIQLGDRVERL